MTSEEHDLITGLFNRLRTADSSNQTPKDQEAVQLIGQLTGQQPAAPYLLVQTLLVQEHALTNAQARIKQLEQQAAQAQQTAKPAASGGFLSGLFGHGSAPAPQAQPIQGQMPAPAPQQAYAQPAPPPYPTTANMAPGAGGGFLKGALGTAAGVAGGALLFQGIENLLGHNAGPFGGGLGGGGFGGGGFGGGGSFLGGGYGGGHSEVIENNEVVNNYYDNDGNRGGGNETAQAGQANGAGNFSDTGFDNSNPFDKREDVGLANDNPAMDNNYDVDNTDASNSGGGLFGGGGDDSSGGGGLFGSNDAASSDLGGGDFGGGNDDSLT